MPATIRSIQALRALACLLVVAFHAVNGTWANGAAGVDLFFVISGTVMGLSSHGLADRPHGWRVFLTRRLRRLLPLYWSMTALKLVIGVALPATLAATRPGGWNILCSLLFIPCRDGAGLVRPVLGVGWTLQFEMLFYALFALALALGRTPIKLVLPALIPLAVAGFWRQPDWPAPLSLANGLVLEFCLGLALAAGIGRVASIRPQWACGLALAGAVLLVVLPSCGPWRFAFWGLPACGLVAAALALERRFGSHVPGVVLAIGEASYAIYLIHPFVVPPILHAVAAARVLGPFAEGCAVLASLALSTACGCGLHRWYEKPVQRWLRGRRGGASGRAGPAIGAVAPGHLVQL